LGVRTRTRRIALGFLAIAAITLGSGEAQMSHAGTANGVKNVVLVHGGFVDGSGWEGVYNDLKKDGFSVTIVQNPTLSLTADVAPDVAAFMADAQVPWGVEALSGAVTEPTWRSKPSWYLVATNDKMIPPDAQRAMSKRMGAKVVEIEGSHAVYVSQPQAVAHLIEEAAKSLTLAAR